MHSVVCIADAVLGNLFPTAREMRQNARLGKNNSNKANQFGNKTSPYLYGRPTLRESLVRCAPCKHTLFAPRGMTTTMQRRKAD